MQFDYTGKESVLVFNLTWPFIKSGLEFDDKPLVLNELDMYLCANVCMNILKSEFQNQKIDIPEHYNLAHQFITDKIIKLSNQ